MGRWDDGPRNGSIRDDAADVWVRGDAMIGWISRGVAGAERGREAGRQSADVVGLSPESAPCGGWPRPAGSGQRAAGSGQRAAALQQRHERHGERIAEMQQRGGERDGGKSGGDGRRRTTETERWLVCSLLRPALLYFGRFPNFAAQPALWGSPPKKAAPFGTRRFFLTSREGDPSSPSLDFWQPSESRPAGWRCRPDPAKDGAGYAHAPALLPVTLLVVGACLPSTDERAFPHLPSSSNSNKLVLLPPLDPSSPCTFVPSEE